MAHFPGRIRKLIPRGGLTGSRARTAQGKAPPDDKNGPNYTAGSKGTPTSAGAVTAANSRTREGHAPADSNNGPRRTNISAPRASAPQNPGGGSAGSSKISGAESAVANSRAPAGPGGHMNGPKWAGNPDTPATGTNPGFKTPSSAMTKRFSAADAGKAASDEEMRHGPVRAKRGGHVKNDHDADDVGAAKGGSVRMAKPRMPRPSQARPRLPRLTRPSVGTMAGASGMPRGMGFGMQQGLSGPGYAKGGSMRLGGGGRFAALKAKFAKRGNVKSPGGLAATIERNKYGNAKSAKMAAAGRRRKSDSAG